jgi:anhydro-N-acetylmuramic acid kinase
MPARQLFIGLMSGTSLDGVDAVLADFAAPRPVLLAHAHHDFAPELREELLRLNTPGDNELHRSSVAAQHLARSYASIVEDLLLHAEVDAGSVRAIGVHGQTVRHRPDAGYTLQLNAPATIAELTGIDVVADLRSRDVAAGGQGAPLVPAFHVAAFESAHSRVVVNLGGIGNVTCLPGGGAGTVIGFDCGPGNVLLDAWAMAHLGQPIDRDGKWAESGRVDEGCSSPCSTNPTWRCHRPRAPGGSLFNLPWLQRTPGWRRGAVRANCAARRPGDAIAVHRPHDR